MVWNGRREIILSGGECATGHDAATGKELWRWWFTPADRPIWQHVVPTPVAADGLIYLIRPEHRPLFALRAGGEGLINSDQVAWTFHGNKAWIATPLLYQGRLYLLQEEQKLLTCLDPKTGQITWEQKLPSKSAFQASPVGADGKIYCLSMAGDVVVMAAGDQPKELAHFSMGEGTCRSTIAVANGRLFIRTAKSLHCIGSTETAPTAPPSPKS
jgi:outer membrane protein assembly factor BamB